MKKTDTREHGKRSLREAIGKEMYVQETGNFDKLDSFTHTAVEPNITARPQSVINQFKPKTCIYCKQPHSFLECTNVVDREKRFSIIKQKNVCYNCFRSHKVSECRSRFRCRKCDNKPNTSLCDSNKNQEKESVRTAKPLPQNTIHRYTIARHIMLLKFAYLSGLRLAHPVSDMDKFRISFLIGSDYYWDIVEDTVIRGPGPTAVESKLGYLLSGPMKASAGPTSSSFMLQQKQKKLT
ncbi:Hypothetical predicted protein [Mytilus galloprovincialis]|uniref:Peptidase aspartic putative domain-containing protein n=1 Tax=Mytilus galloprovincialis TaxID=29158 RepID=A0A8B6FI77_MYTGA|nr:Hypothetical predicted protein [Mytilus galloprovincialis]